MSFAFVKQLIEPGSDYCQTPRGCAGPPVSSFGVFFGAQCARTLEVFQRETAHWGLSRRPQLRALVTFPGFVPVSDPRDFRGQSFDSEMFKNMFAIQTADAGPDPRTDTGLLHISHKTATIKPPPDRSTAKQQQQNRPKRWQPTDRSGLQRQNAQSHCYSRNSN